MKKQQKITLSLFIIYLIILTWIILFKMHLPTDIFPHTRSINLIPFSESMIVNGRIAWNEIIYNIAAFIPVGIYLGMLKENQPVMKKLLPVIGITASYEIGQYILAVGASDITDIINNTIGGAVGLLIFFLLSKLWKDKTCKILTAAAAVCTVLLAVFLSVLIMANY